MTRTFTLILEVLLVLACCKLLYDGASFVQRVVREDAEIAARRLIP